MAISIKTRQAYTEIDNFIELLDEFNKNKIPKKVREYFKREKDYNYEKNIEPNKHITEQNLKRETLVLIAILNLKYWCEDEEEKRRLRKVYEYNEMKYQNEIRDKYNPDKIFESKSNKSTNIETTEIAIIPCKESFIEKCINRIKKIFIK